MSAPTHLPRLLRPVGDPAFAGARPSDAERRRILRNVLTDCEAYAARRPWRRIPERPDSPHPFHQLYLAFYTGMQATALIETYAFAWRVTGEARWLRRARAWLLAAARWEHNDRIEEHFYTANRYMQAFALGLDLLGEALTPGERQTVTGCLVRLMERWWPDVDAARRSPEGGHHAVVDNGHFGVAALQLLGEHPQAETWLEAVVERFRVAIMPHGCGRDGEPVDGPSFWPWENLWMLQFADALRNVTGTDLYREFPARLRRPLCWFGYHLAVPARIGNAPYAQGDSNLIGAAGLRACSVPLLRLAQEAGDAHLRAVALSDPDLGRLLRFGVGVKGSTAECVVAYGPYAYCYLDPDFAAVGSAAGSRQRLASPPVSPQSRKFTRAHYGESAVLRTGWKADAVVACVSGYRAGSAHGFSNLQIQWRGQPLLRTISAHEARPVGCGCLPAVGGQNEFVAGLGRLESSDAWDRLAVTSQRLEQEYLLLRGAHPVLLVAARRRRRGVRLGHDATGAFARLDGRDHLQYARDPHFDARGGELRLRVRLRETPDPERLQVLLNAGLGVAQHVGTRVNNFNLGFLKTRGLAFAVQSQRYHVVQVEVPPEVVRIEPGRWHDVRITWSGFNQVKGAPFIELCVDGHSVRCDEAARFGELGRDSQGLASRSTPRTFHVDPNSELAFGAATQMPGTGVRCDLAGIELRCRGRRPLAPDFGVDLGPETGAGAITWKLNPAALRSVRGGRAALDAGGRVVEVVPLYGDGLQLTTEEVPYAPSGLAAGSLKSFQPGASDAAPRLLVSTPGDVVVFAIAEHRARLRVRAAEDGVEMQLGERRTRLRVGAAGRPLLRL